ncbi:MAG: peptide deformylase [Lachnospiraceae bacterium]|jgi:peptide deformylase|nr:peptide deformylase [Lachnospiraceae bacterium]MEE3460500.1 peptide deformylase [Lachnospiraceae bacterium]
MALRTIRTYGDEILTKTSRPVTQMKPKYETLIDDMLDTMYDAHGVGLAAVQVGILRRIVVIDVSPEGNSPIVLINPEIIEKDGEQTGQEGCLSVPGRYGIVTRAEHVKVKALDRDMNEQVYEGEGLLARAFQHEIDHLDGKMYVDLAEGGLKSYDEDDEEEEEA